jgi:hypothetical protein
LDVSGLFAPVAEPFATERLRALLVGARARLTESQRAAMAAWEYKKPLDRSTRAALQLGPIDPVHLRKLAADLARGRHAPESQSDGQFDGAFDRVPEVLAQAAVHPAAASAVLWSWLAARDGGAFAGHLVQRVRELAELPGICRRLATSDPALQRASDVPALVTAFLDLQLEDACAWLERVPPPLPAADGASLARQRAAIEDTRAGAPHKTASELAGFARLAATFVVQLSARGLDPLGFSLGREVQLDADPALDRRLEIAAWALQAGRSLCPRGQMFVIAIPVAAPWPLRFELVAAELGRGACGGLGMVARLAGDAPVVMTERAPVLLCLPGEPTEERGPRFERWLSDAYPAAIRAWQAWL